MSPTADADLEELIRTGTKPTPSRMAFVQKPGNKKACLVYPFPALPCYLGISIDYAENILVILGNPRQKRKFRNSCNQKYCKSEER